MQGEIAMNYSRYSANEQRLQIAAYGFEKAVRPDCYDVRQAMAMADIANDAYRVSDPAKSILGFAVFIKPRRWRT